MAKEKKVKFKESIGLDIGSHSIKMVHLRKLHEGFKLLNYEIRSTVPDGIEPNLSDLSTDRFAPVLSGMLRSMKINPKKVKHIVSSIGGDNVSVTTGQTTIFDFTLIPLGSPEYLVANLNTNDVTLVWEMPTDNLNRANLNTTGKVSFYNQRNRKTKKQQEEPQTDSNRALTGFKVYRNNAMIAQIDDPAIMTYFDEFLNAGEYSYFVTAVYDGQQESVPSNTEEVTIILVAPTNLEGIASDPNIELSWTAPSASRSLTAYNIYRDDLQIAQVTETSYADAELENGTYVYFVKALYGLYESDASNEVIVELTEADNILIPARSALLGNYPNPFNPTTTIKFALSEDSYVSLDIYNIKGERVRTLVQENLTAQYHSILWNGLDSSGKQVSSGIYFYKMKAGKFVSNRKMILLK